MMTKGSVTVEGKVMWQTKWGIEKGGVRFGIWSVNRHQKGEGREKL